LEAHNLARQRNGVLVLPALKTKHPEIVQSTDIARVIVQNNRVALPCLIQFALLMQCYRPLKYLVSGNLFVRLARRADPEFSPARSSNIFTSGSV